VASQADICNLALTKLGSGSRITALTDASVAAGALRAVYDLIRKDMLRAHYWAFSIKRTSLAASATTPTWGFSQAYPLPADFLRLVQVNQFYLIPGLLDYNTADASAWSVEENADGVNSILCDYSAPLKIRYIKDVTDEGRFDSLFVTTFADRLALEVCEQITNSNTKKQAITEDYKRSLAQAMRTSAIEKPPALIGDDSWVMARL
jgi:hypothetical protein